MASPQRVVIPFNTPLSPGSPANEQGVQKVENLVPVYGGMRSVPVPSGDSTSVLTVDDEDVIEGEVGVVTDVPGAIIAVGGQTGREILYYNEGDLSSEPTIGVVPSFDSVIPVVGTRSSLFVCGERFSSYGGFVGDPEEENTFGVGPLAEPWSMAQFGSFVVATNYLDPVLKITLGDPETGSEFSVRKLITTLSRPRAKHLTVVGGHLLLGSLRFTDDTNTELSDSGVYEENPLITGFTEADSDGNQVVKGYWPNAIWWSAQKDASFFSSPANANATGDPDYEAPLAIESLSDFEIITDVPGEVTGMIGFPEAAVIFSKYGSSLLQLTRGPEVFERRVLELGIGCTSSKSLVAVDQDVYFFSQDGFRVLSGFSKSQSIMTPQLRRALLDRRFGRDYVLKNSSQIKFVTWDPSMRVIFWWYLNLDDRLVAAVYSVDTQNFTFIKDSSLEDYFVGASVPDQYPFAGTYLSKKEAQNPYTVTTRRWLNGEESDEIKTLEATVRTKTFTLFPDQGQVGAQMASIVRLRPIYRVYSDSDPQVVPDPKFKIISSLDPNMRVEVTETDAFSQTSSVRRKDGWFRPRAGVVKGCAFEIECSYPEAQDQTLWDVIGVQVEYVPAGES